MHACLAASLGRRLHDGDVLAETFYFTRFKSQLDGVLFRMMTNSIDEGSFGTHVALPSIWRDDEVAAKHEFIQGTRVLIHDQHRWVIWSV